MHIMNLDHNNSNPTNLDDDDDSHINAPVTTSASPNMEAFCATNPCRDNPGSLSGVQLYYPAEVCGSGFVGSRYGNVPGPGFRGWVQNVRPSVSRATFVTAPDVESPPVMSTVRYSDGLYLGNRVCDNSVSWMRVKLWCFYGGMIRPKAPDWALKYVGGESKILNVRGNVSLNELVQKIADLCGQFNVLKYQVPEVDNLDALVSVESTDDLENMMEEYEGMVKKSSDGRARLKVFLFSPPRRVSSAAVQMRGFQSNAQRYIEEVETIVDENGAAITRTESMASATFTQDSDLSGTEAIDGTGHDKVEEVKGIVDGNGGSITRKESMASATSMQDLDLSEAAAINSTGHEQVDFEEAKGIVDGNGGSITRKESMATATSMQDSDLSEAAAISSTGHEQVDFEEAKEIVDGDGGGITRKESMASATSMQDSDSSEAAAINNTGHEQVDFEEVKGIGDEDGGGITRKESMATATSMQDSDLSEAAAINSTGHEQIDFEEVKGIVDGDGGGIMRKESMATATSMQDSDLSTPEAIDSTGHEQEDIEEVKRIVDGNGGGITRSESMASATSMQDSDGHGHGDNTGITSSGDVSSENNFTASHENAHRLVCMDPNPPVHVEPASDPLGIPAVGSHPLVLSKQPVAVVQPQQQQQAGIRPCAPYFQAYVDPQQEVLSHAEHVQYPSHMRSPSQLLATDAPVLTQHQKRDIVASVTPNQFIPVLQMPMTPHSYANTKPTAVQPVTEPHQVRPEHFHEENMSGQWRVHFSGDQSYNVCHAQDSQPHTILGGHGWHQAPQIERVPSSDGFRQQVALTDNMPRFEEGYMCKKALLRTHSDTLAQGQRESPTTTSNFSPIYQSLQPGDKIRGQPVSTAALSATLAEGIIENQVTEEPATSLSHLDHEGRNPEYGEVAISQYIDDRTSLQRKKDHSHPQASVPQCVEGGPQSCDSVFMGNTPQLYQEHVFQKPVVPMQHKAKEEGSNRTAVSVASVEYTSSQVPDHLVHDPSKEQSGKLPGFVSKEGMLEPSIAYDQPKKIDSRMKTSGVCPSEVLDNEQIMSPAGNSKQKDIIDSREYPIDNYKQNKVFYCPSNEVPCSHNEVLESYELIQPPLLGIDSAQVAKRSPPIGELKHDASRNYSIIDCDVEALHNDGNNLISPVNRVGDMQDNSNSLLSSKDPRNLPHDTHIPPPGPNEILTRNEAQSGDPFGDSRFGRSGEPATGDSGDFTSELLTEDGGHLPSGKLVADYTVRLGKEEEHIKQELQAVAEGVATSVPQTCVPFGPASQDSKVQNNDEVLHANKTEDMKLKLPERANLGYPVSDGLGRLQIIKNSDLEELQELGSGTIGTVYYGKWRGSDVAIKRINARWFAVKPSEQERMRDDFWNEAIKLADLHHPNVVAFYGVALDGPGGSVATVTEYMVNGSLRDVFQKNEKNLDMQKIVMIAKEVAFGMEYLHGKNIVHLNLKSDNLLVNLLDPDRPVCKVGDLGLSEVKRKTLIPDGIPWMAPELLDGRSNLVTEKVDVFSFGIVLWELLTGEEPYRDLHYGTLIGGIVNNTLRPPVPDSCDPDWRSLMERCWSGEPSERPNFTEVVNQLQTMAAKGFQKVQAEQQPFSNQPQVKT